eukprot:4315235-Alexandrium_andersonii.AAC.1
MLQTTAPPARLPCRRRRWLGLGALRLGRGLSWQRRRPRRRRRPLLATGRAGARRAGPARLWPGRRRRRAARAAGRPLGGTAGLRDARWRAGRELALP